MHDNFVNIGLPEDKVIEECAEVIQAITKIKRFGLFNHHPDRPDTTNLDEVLSEIKDLENALILYKEELYLNISNYNYIKKILGSASKQNVGD
jgi:NTP pyrophosphatase (non-canonical NTP hydrolase)